MPSRFTSFINPRASALTRSYGVVACSLVMLLCAAMPLHSQPAMDEVTSDDVVINEESTDQSDADTTKERVEANVIDDADETTTERDSDSDKNNKADKKPKQVSISFQNADARQIAQFLMKELGKPVIVDERVQQARITIMSEDKMPLPDALELIGNALRQKGVLIAESKRQTELVPIEELRRLDRVTIAPDESVEDMANQSAIVDKSFSPEHYDVNRLKDLVLSMLPEYAVLIADPNLNRLVVTAAAADIVPVERLVATLDVPRANETEQRVFQLEHGDASEVVSLVRTLISASLGVELQAAFTSPTNRGNNQRNSRNSRSKKPSTPTNALFVERSEAPVMLQADLSRNWIIAAAPPPVMDEIEKWITELDVKKESSEPYELFDISHADVGEIAAQLNETISAMPDRDIQASVRVIPFIKSRQLLVYGSQRGRGLVRSLLSQLDVESSQYQLIREIALEHDSAENVKAKIEELFGKEDTSSLPYWQRGRSSSKDSNDLTVTADTQRNTVTIMTDPTRMKRIEDIIAEQWDVPLDLDEVKPKVYALRYTDPVQVKTILEDMFTKSTSSGFSFWRAQETTTPVGRLFGEFSFVAMKDSNKLIVSTKNPANYKVIDDLLLEIDQPQDAGVPIVIELKHANAEDVAEQLNAMFSQPGTPASITRNERGLSDSIRQSGTTTDRGSNTTNNNQNNNQNNRQNNNQTTDASQMAFWWSQSRPNVNEQPTSNLIGKPRIVPVNRRNALMILAPRAHVEPFRKLIAELDQPGSQVVIHAIITEIQHDDESTLGVRIASDPGIFNDSRLADQSIGGGVNANVATEIFDGDGILNANFNLNFLIQFLVKNLNLKVLNEPRVYTADNQEAHFFDGQDVPIIVSDFTGGNNNNGNITRSFEYEAVGTRLHVRPHITQEGEVDLEINLEISRIQNGSSVFGNFIFDRRETTTHVTVQDGQTIVISGIVQQEDFNEVRKLPFFGDLPLIGGLFRSSDKASRNREIIAFVTPHVVRDNQQEEEISERNREWLERVRGAVEEPVDEDDPDRLITTPDERSRTPSGALPKGVKENDTP